MYGVKTFTVEEANQLLEVLRPLLIELEATHDRILSLQAQIDAIELVAESSNDSPSTNLDEAEAHMKELNEAASKLNDIAGHIQEHGCYLKGIRPTLIDFFHTAQDGRVIYLCWEAGESEISHWHEVGSGYTNRRPLSKLKDA